MNRTTRRNAHVSLSSHKGTPIRYHLFLQDGASVLVEPLLTGAEGLVLDSRIAAQYLDLGEGLEGKYALISGDGDVLETIEMKGPLASIEATVVYPSGATWEGKLEQSMEGVGLLVWDWQLAHRLKNCDKNTLFEFGRPWYEVPTTVLFFDERMLADCGHSHACPKQCDAITKFL